MCGVLLAVERAKQYVGAQFAVGAALSVWLVRPTEPNGRGGQLSLPPRQQDPRVSELEADDWFMIVTLHSVYVCVIP